MTLRLAKLGYRGLRAVASLSLARSGGHEYLKTSGLFNAEQKQFWFSITILNRLGLWSLRDVIVLGVRQFLEFVQAV